MYDFYLPGVLVMGIEKNLEYMEKIGELCQCSNSAASLETGHDKKFQNYVTDLALFEAFEASQSASAAAPIDVLDVVVLVVASLF